MSRRVPSWIVFVALAVVVIIIALGSTEVAPGASEPPCSEVADQAQLKPVLKPP